MNINRILTIVLVAASLFLAFRLYRGVQGTIEDREAIFRKLINVTPPIGIHLATL